MPLRLEDLVSANRAQIISETDSFTAERYQQFHNHFPRLAKTVLDVGCNTGRGGRVLKSRDASLRIIGLDCVPERIATLDKSIYETGICEFSTAIPLEDRSLDVIVAGEFVEHLPPQHVDTTLNEFFRLLRLKGRLLLTT